MTRGMRVGALTRAELMQRLESAQPAAWSAIPDKEKKNMTVARLLGHALFHKLVKRPEEEETVPRTEATVSCYLNTYVTNPVHREQIERYVKVASRLVRRGSIILNLIAQTVCGARLPGAPDIWVSVLRPRFSDDPASQTMEPFRAMAAMLDGDPRSNPLKHAMLPERWPSQETPRCPSVEAIIQPGAPLARVIPPAPADWTTIMSVSGWDNAINDMMVRLCANLKTHAAASLPKYVRQYLGCVPMDADTPRWLLIDTTLGKPRPLTAHQDDWEMAMALRRILVGVSPQGTMEWERARMTRLAVPDSVEYSPEVLLLHFFLCRYGVADRSYLPVSSRGRKYAYIDGKIASKLFAATKVPRKKPSTAEKKERSKKTSKPQAAGASQPQDDPGPSRPPEPPVPQPQPEPSINVGEILGLTPELFNRRRRQLRREIRQRYRQRARDEADGAKRRRRRKQAKRWQRIGASAMRKNARVDSILTDGVGLRIVVKSPIDMTPYKKPLEASAIAAARPPPARKKKLKPKAAPEEQEPPLFSIVPASRPIFVGIDLGRAKLFTAAVSREVVRRPSTVILTRRQYYYDMRHGARRRWEERRMEATPVIRAAVDSLSQAGGTLHTCDPDAWQAYLTAETAHRALLDQEYVDEIERARWRMVMFRGKRNSTRCLDNATQRVLKAAVEKEPKSRHLVIGIGDAAFPCNGPRGELPAPTSELSKALSRGLRRVRDSGRDVTVKMVDEFRTTKCCCACGAETTASTVRRRYRDRQTGATIIQDGASRRLRRCDGCHPGVGRLRDRDVQASRNMLWVVMAESYGLQRPCYLRRPVRVA